MVQEIELKLSISVQDRDALLQHEIVRQAASSFKQLQLVNQYFDTPDQLLTKHQIALRIRTDGDRWIQTIKGKGSQAAGLHQRLELEWELSKPELDISLVPSDIWPDSVNPEKLAPLFNTDFSRQQWQLTGPDGAHIELVLDQGAVTCDSDTDVISEIELELKSGQPSALFRLALELAKDIPLVPCDISKAERGYRLINKQPRAWAEMPEVRPEQPIQSVFESVMAYELETLQRQWEVFQFTQNWTHLYQFRNTLGNIRTHFLLFSDMLATAGVESAIGHVDWLEAQVSPLLSWWPACFVLSQQASDQPRSVSDQLHQAKARQALDQLERLRRTPEFGAAMLSLGDWLHCRNWTKHHTDVTAARAAQSIGKAMLEPLRQTWLSMQLSECGGNVSAWLQKQSMVHGLNHVCQTLERILGKDMQSLRQELSRLEDNLVELSAMDMASHLGDWLRDISQDERLSINSWARSQTVVMRNMNRLAGRMLDTLADRKSVS